MSEIKELKPKSFRIDDETAEKFKKVAADIGGNQQQTLSKLIEAYEFQSSKATLMNKKADIEEFENYITIITRKYMDSLEENQSLADMVRAEFAAQLKSKDTTIQDLQSQLETARQLKEEAMNQTTALSDENDRLQKEVAYLNKDYNSKMTNMQSMLEDKDSLNKALTDSCNELKVKVENMEDAAKQSEALQATLERLQKEYEQTLTKASNLENQLQQERTAHEEELKRVQEQAQFDCDKAVLEVEKTYQNQIQELKAKSQAEIDDYQRKYLTLIEQMRGQVEIPE